MMVSAVNCLRKSVLIPTINFPRNRESSNAQASIPKAYQLLAALNPICERPQISLWHKSALVDLQRRNGPIGLSWIGWRHRTDSPHYAGSDTKKKFRDDESTTSGRHKFLKRKSFMLFKPLKKVIQRCLLMTSDPGDLVFDPTCGSGTTAKVAEKWGRRWITCDTSRVAVSLASSA